VRHNRRHNEQLDIKIQLVAPPKKVVKLSSLAIQLPNPAAQAQLQALPHIKLLIAALPLEKLYQIEEAIMHELYLRNILLADEYHTLSMQHQELTFAYEDLKAKKEELDVSHCSLTTIVHELYQRVPQQT
jgi:hypothetical protein